MRFLLISLALVFCSNIADAQDLSWHHYIHSPSNLTPTQLEVTDDGTLFLLTAEKAIYYRELGQDEWEPVVGVFGWWNHDNIGVNPENNRLFVGTSGHGIRYTDDYGENWGLEYFYTLPTSGLHASIQSIAFSNDNDMVILGGDYNPSTSQLSLYRSFNNGNSWTSSLTPNTYHKLFVTSDDHILGATYSEGIYRSTSNGLNWSFLSLPGDRVLDFAEDNEGNLYSAIYETFDSSVPGIFKSTDGGETWSDMNEGLGLAPALCVVFDPVNERLLCGTELGVFEYDGSAWQNIGANLEDDPVNDLTILNDEYYAAARFFGVHKEDPSPDWEKFNQGIAGGITGYIFNEDENLYAAYNAILSENTDPDLPWENFHLNNITESFNRFEKFLMNDNGDIFVLDFNDVYRSTDGGSTYENITPSIPIGPFNSYISFSDMNLGQNGELLLYQTLDDRMYHSVDNGDSFQELVSVDEIPEFMQLTDFVVTEDGRYYIYLVNFGIEEKLYTSDDGETWTDIDLEPVLIFGSGAGEDLHVLENNTVIFSINHQPYEINPETNAFEIIEVPWTFENPNAFYGMYSNTENHIFIDMFATFGDLDSEGIWQSTDLGETWTNIGFPEDSDSAILYGNRIKEGPNGLPFMIAGNSGNDLYGLFYYGEENVFVGLSEFQNLEQGLRLFPNPVEDDNFIIQFDIETDVDHISMRDLTGKNIPIKYLVSHDQVKVSFVQKATGIYLIDTYSGDKRVSVHRVVVK